VVSNPTQISNAGAIMEEKAYFSKKLLCTAPDGTYSSFGGSKKVSAYSDRIEIGKTSVPYSRIIEIKNLGKVLHIIYVDPSGKRIENYFRNDTFLPKKGIAELHAFQETSRQFLAKMPVAAQSSSAYSSALSALRCERSGEKNGRQQVVVYSGSVAFPPICPFCLGSPASVSQLSVGSTLGARGFWLVPVCKQHKVKSSIKVPGWKSQSSQITFSFSQSEYAERFYQLNLDPEKNPWKSAAESSETIHSIQAGTRFVVYQIVISAIRISIRSTSDVHMVHSVGNAVLKGLPYTVCNLLIGWWSIAGLIWTPMAIYRNVRGGIDVTLNAASATLGKPISAFGV
jgi:hypothetical protein